MQAGGFQKALAPQVVVDVYRHAVIRIGRTFLRILQMVRDEFQPQRFGRRPGQGLSGRGQCPGFEIG